MPAVATTIYTVSSTNNAFENELNPMIGFLDSHVSLRIRNLTFCQAMSMLLSTYLLSQLVTIGAGSSFFVLFCVLLSILPFLFDGLMSLISLVQQNILQAVGPERHERPREQEDSF